MTIFPPYLLLAGLISKKLYDILSYAEKEDYSNTAENSDIRKYRELVRKAIQQKNPLLQSVETQEQANIVLSEWLQSAQSSIRLYLPMLPENTELPAERILRQAKSHHISVQIVVEKSRQCAIEKELIQDTSIRQLHHPPKFSYFAIIDEAGFMLLSKDNPPTYIVCLHAESEQDTKVLTSMNACFNILWDEQSTPIHSEPHTNSHAPF